MPWSIAICEPTAAVPNRSPGHQPVQTDRSRQRGLGAESLQQHPRERIQRDERDGRRGRMHPRVLVANRNHVLAVNCGVVSLTVRQYGDDQNVHAASGTRRDARRRRAHAVQRSGVHGIGGLARRSRRPQWLRQIDAARFSRERTYRRCGRDHLSARTQGGTGRTVPAGERQRGAASSKRCSTDCRSAAASAGAPKRCWANSASTALRSTCGRATCRADSRTV